METNDVLADEVQIGGPILFILFAVIAVRRISQPRDIVRQRVQPDVHDVLLVERHLNPPLERGSGNAEILQPLQKKIVHHFVLAGNGLNKFGVRVDMLNQPVRIFSHFEEIRFLFRGFDFPAAVRAFPVHELALRPERLAGRTVHAFVVTFIYISLIVKFLENLRHFRFVILVRGADKFVVGGVHQVPDPLDFTRHLVYVLFRRHARRGRLVLDLLTVFVRSRLKKYVVALFALEPRDCVRQYRFVRIADMRLARSVCDRRRDIIRLLLFCHFAFSPFFRILIRSLLYTIPAEK